VIVTEVRLDVELISPMALAQYMDHRDLSVRALAEKVDHITRGRTKSRSTIGHLRSGARKTCDPVTAKAIERALDAPPGSLFVARLSTVQREKGRAA
jgi:hypothetical protein